MPIQRALRPHRNVKDVGPPLVKRPVSRLRRGRTMHKPLKDWNAAYSEGINAREVADAITPYPLPDAAEHSQNSHFAEPAWPVLHEAAYYGWLARSCAASNLT